MQIIINGKSYAAYPDEKILDVALRNGIIIPTLCHSEALPGLASCRLCMVEVHENGRTQNVASCTYPVADGMEVNTESEVVVSNRQMMLKIYHLMAPESDKIKNLLASYHVPAFDRLPADQNNKCILCGLCVKACDELGAYAISTLNRGTKKKIGTAFNEPSVDCIGCAACVNVCPTDAIEMVDHEGERTIWQKTFRLIRCKDCGEYFTTAEALAHIRRKLGEAASNIEELQLCDHCKKKRTVIKLKDGLHLSEAFDSLLD